MPAVLGHYQRTARQAEFLIRRRRLTVRRVTLGFSLFFLFILGSTLARSSLGLALTQPTWKRQWDQTLGAAKKEGRL
jgi:hypothetical protein